MQGKITKSTVEKLGLNSVMWDSALSGFGARRQLRHVHYLLRYRINGKQRFLTIGKHGMWTPDTARTEAKRLLGLVASKVDPASERVRPVETVSAEIERYLERKRASLKPRSFDALQRHLRFRCKPLHHLRLGEIDRRTIAQTLAEIESGSGPVARNRIRSSLSAFFAWAIREGLAETNPVLGTATADEGQGRDRALSEAELRAIWDALRQDHPFSDIIRLLILTAQRREEIGGLRWAEIDFDRGLIVLGPERTKNKRLHELPISTQVRAILERQPRNGEFVWGRRWTNWSAAKAQLDLRTKGNINPWRLHDCRRTAATMMAELGTQPHHVETVLNHVSGFRAGVAGIYVRAKFEDQIRQALQQWADYVDSLTNR
jgi:integrase